MAFAACLTEFYVTMIKISDLTNGRVTSLTDQTNFPGGHTDLRKIAFFREQLSRATCRANELTTPPLLELNIMDQGTDRDICDGECIP
jgi:hypothetical protein